MTATANELLTPYSTVSEFTSLRPEWMSEFDAERITAYQTYEQIYWNVPETFKLVFRGTEDNPIYVPTGRVIVDTTNRYVGKGFGYTLDPDVGTPADRLALDLALKALFRRERFWSKFASNKRFGIVRGDWCWHVLANPLKPEGSRISIEELDPAAYFPQWHPDDPDKLIAVHIVEQFLDGEKIMIKRQTYTKGANPLENDGSDTSIWNSIGLFDLKAWESIELNPVKVIKPPTALPPQIKAIPVYHIRNIETPGDPFGSSELRGIERIIGAINQAVSDEELALALDGLGMFATDGGAPKDAQGNVTDWILGPGSVVEHAPGSKFSRVSGVSTVTPFQDHLKYLASSAKEATGTPDVAIGKIDVTVAESGIALQLQMGPMLSKVEERDQPITDVHRQMLYDLSTGWLPAYEGIDSAARAEPSYEPTIPEDVAGKITEILAMVTAQVVTAEWARTEISRLRGYIFPENMDAAIVSEAQARATATDPFAVRMAAEADTVEQ